MTSLYHIHATRPATGSGICQLSDTRVDQAHTCISILVCHQPDVLLVPAVDVVDKHHSCLWGRLWLGKVGIKASNLAHLQASPYSHVAQLAYAGNGTLIDGLAITQLHQLCHTP